MEELKKLTEEKLMDFVDYVYGKTLNGLPMPGCESAQELAESYLKDQGNISDKVDSLIKWQIAKCATTGFLSGIGGALSIPAVVANIGSVLYVQLRMIAAIAYMGGYNPKDDQVKTFVYACLLGNSVEEAFKGNLAIPIGKVMAEAAIKKIPREIIGQINKAVGVKLVTKFGEKGIINLGKAVPAVGGIIGGTLDGVTTKAIGVAAKRIFISKNT